MSKSDTDLIHRGRPESGRRRAVNPPLVRTSTVLADSLAELRAGAERPFDDFFYGRFGTPTHAALADALLAMGGGAGCVFYPSGLAAVAGTLLAYARSGGHLLVSDCVYEPTRKLCDTTLAAMGMRTEYFVPGVGADIAGLLRDDTVLVLVESPGSLTMEVEDLPALCAAARAAGVPVAVDNTWATPYRCAVLSHGADIDIQAATKYLGGHADLMLGVASCSEAAFERVRLTAVRLGYCASADDAWLALRGVRTLAVRLRQHEAAAQRVAGWLGGQAQVRRVMRPGQGDSAALFARDFSGGNGLFSIECERWSDRQLAAFCDGLQLFGLGFSWGGYESLCLPFDPAPVRSHGDWSGRGRFLRLHIGLEEPEDLIADLAAGFERVASAA